MAQIPGIDSLKEIFTGTGKRQKELIEEYKGLAQNSPEEAKKILEAILRLIRQEQFLRTFASVALIVLVVIYALAIRFEKYIFNEGVAWTKETAVEFLSEPDNRGLFNLKITDMQVGIEKDGKILGFLGNTKSNDFITLVKDSKLKSQWLAQNNSSPDMAEAIKLSAKSGNIYPKTNYPAYEQGVAYPYRGLDNFWFKIKDASTEIKGNDTIYMYNILFGEGSEEDISWDKKPVAFINSPNGLGNINDSPPQLIEKEGWMNAYIVFFGIGRFFDNRVYKVYSEAYAFSIKDGV